MPNIVGAEMLGIATLTPTYAADFVVTKTTDRCASRTYAVAFMRMASLRRRASTRQRMAHVSMVHACRGLLSLED